MSIPTLVVQIDHWRTPFAGDYRDEYEIDLDQRGIKFKALIGRDDLLWLRVKIEEALR